VGGSGLGATAQIKGRPKGNAKKNKPRETSQSLVLRAVYLGLHLGLPLPPVHVAWPLRDLLLQLRPPALEVRPAIQALLIPHRSSTDGACCSTGMPKVRADKKQNPDSRAKTTNKTVFFFALEKNHLPLQGVAAVHIEVT
jgi:hypothetical protein